MAESFESQPLIHDPNELQAPAIKTGESSKDAAAKTEPEQKSKVVRQKLIGPMQFLASSPIMQNLQSTMVKNMQTLDEMEEKFKKEEQEVHMARLTSHLPQEIKGSGQPNETILSNLETILLKLITEEDSSEESHGDQTLNIPGFSEQNYKKPSVELDRLNELTCLSATIYSYLQILKHKNKKGEKLKEIANEIYEKVSLWLSKLFRFHDSNAIFHKDDYEGVKLICNLIMNIKYDNLNTESYKLFHKKEPVIYISAASKYAKESCRLKICTMLGLPLSSIQLVKVCTLPGGSFEKIEKNEFILQVEKDISEGKLPQVLVANAGSYKSGQCDDIQEIEEICMRYKIWLHVDGVHLSTLALYAVPTAIQNINSGDSITLDFGCWIGVPSLNYVTLYKTVDSAYETIQSYKSNVDCLYEILSYWCVLQAIGHEGVIDRIRYTSEYLSQYVKEVIYKQQPFLKIVEFKDNPNEVATTTRQYTISEIISKALSLITIVELHNPIIIFKCNDRFTKDILTQFKVRLSGKNREEELNDYCNTLTSWFYDVLNSTHKKFSFELIELEHEGVCIRYSPVEQGYVLLTGEEALAEFKKSLDDIMTILDTTVRCKAIFEQKLKLYPNLKPISIAKWAGIGAITYVPENLLIEITNINQKAEVKNEINELNTEIVKILQAKDSAFSMAVSVDSIVGVKFGMVNDIENLNNLMNEVQKTGKNVEETFINNRIIQNMADIIKQGIEKANEDLKREHEKKVQQEGVFKHIPLVGGLLSWIAPSPEPEETAGRTFDLLSGKILKTENVYKSHKQIVENDSSSESNVSISTRVTRESIPSDAEEAAANENEASTS